jgi:putative DNA primase/helicase
MTIFKNTIAAFVAEMANQGAFIKSPTPDGKTHAFKTDGDQHGQKSGVYALRIDSKTAASGYFEDLKTGLAFFWTLSGDSNDFSPKLYEAIMAARQHRKLKFIQQQQQTAVKAQRIWERTKPTHAMRKHPDLKQKSLLVKSARLYRNALVLPMFDEMGKLVNLQFIDQRGNQRFLDGGPVVGCFLPLQN